MLIGQLKSAAHWPTELRFWLAHWTQLLIGPLNSASHWPTELSFSLAYWTQLLIGLLTSRIKDLRISISDLVDFLSCFSRYNYQIEEGRRSRRFKPVHLDRDIQANNDWEFWCLVPAHWCRGWSLQWRPWGLQPRTYNYEPVPWLVCGGATTLFSVNIWNKSYHRKNHFSILTALNKLSSVAQQCCWLAEINH